MGYNLSVIFTQHNQQVSLLWCYSIIRATPVRLDAVRPPTPLLVWVSVWMAAGSKVQVWAPWECQQPRDSHTSSREVIHWGRLPTRLAPWH